MNLLMRRVDRDVTRLDPDDVLARFPSRLSIEQYREGEESGELCELEESWLFLDKSLRRCPGADLAEVVTGGDLLKEFPEDGTTLVFVTPERTATASAALAALDQDVLRTRIGEVLAENVNGELPPGLLDEMLYRMAELTAFFRQAAESGQGVLKNVYL
ncbi:DUF1877 family protein [Kitasatospora sp. NPDC094016]|uniref:DUF1877 family protein n=1 Tax=Kitasatospora sp. NPDC094016 TaxID=3154986 RepID=UPI0033320D7B